VVGFYEKPLLKFERVLASYVSTFPYSLVPWLTAVPLWLRQKLWFPAELRRHTGYRGEVLYVDHHLCHAAGAYFPSPFGDAAILTVDGVGEWTTTTMGQAEGNEVWLEREIYFPHSLGLLYSAVTAHLGFKVNNDEYKVMGLASYGQPRYMEEMGRLIRLYDDGSFALDMRYFAFHRALRMLSAEGQRLLGPARLPESDLEQRHCDLAASVQAKLEEAVVRLARAVHERTGRRNLAFGGGVALNCVANSRLLSEAGFDRVWIQPATGDDGGAVGVALYIHHTVQRSATRWRMEAAYLGPGYTDGEIRADLTRLGAPYREVGYADLPQLAARLVWENRIVGWFQGRMEWGPRALGNRSILANACNPEMKDILNNRVKHREDFRPFAPVVPLEESGRYFAFPQDMPFMLAIAEVVPEQRDRIPAVTHVDGTARPQTVTREQNALYYVVLRAFEQLSGVPVVINTSFNVRGEPIVCSPQDAYRCFARTGLDDLLIGPFHVRKEDLQGAGPPAPPTGQGEEAAP